VTRYRPVVTPAQIEEIGRRLATATSYGQIADALDLDRQTVRLRARPFIEAMRAAGTLPLCSCGQERFHRYFCSRTIERPVGPRKATEEQLARRKLMVTQIMTGKPFAQLAEQLNSSKRSVMRYLRYLTPEQLQRRRLMESTRSRTMGLERRPAPAFRDGLYARISAAVPHWISPATRDDAMSDIYVAVMEGRVVDIEADASQYAKAALNMWENHFGALPLDEPRFGDRRLTIADRVPDPAALDAFDRLFEEEYPEHG
jgi:hypothetical protein